MTNNTKNSKKDSSDSCLILKFTCGERQLYLEPGKTKYLMMQKGFTKKEAEATTVEAWAHNLVWSVAKAYHSK